MSEQLSRILTFVFIAVIPVSTGYHLTWDRFRSPERIREAKIKMWEKRTEDFFAKQIQPPYTRLGIFVFNHSSVNETR